MYEYVYICIYIYIYTLYKYTLLSNCQYRFGEYLMYLLLQLYQKAEGTIELVFIEIIDGPTVFVWPLKTHS